METPTKDVVEALKESLGEDCVLTGDAVSDRASGIWRSDPIQAKAIIRPRNTEQVSQALAICHAHDQPVVAHGGLTGLVESAIASPDDVALSLERLNQIEEINELDRTMVVQSGVILQTLQETADDHGLMFPLDLGGRGSCTIGGNISTNAGGNRVIRYGMTRDMVLGLEAVLADGTVVTSHQSDDQEQRRLRFEAAVSSARKGVLELLRERFSGCARCRRIPLHDVCCCRRVLANSPAAAQAYRLQISAAALSGIRSDVEQLLLTGDHGTG